MFKYFFVFGLIAVGLMASTALLMEIYFHKQDIKKAEKDKAFNADTVKYTKELQNKVKDIVDRQQKLIFTQQGIIKIQSEFIGTLIDTNSLDEDAVKRLVNIYYDSDIQIPNFFSRLDGAKNKKNKEE